MFKVIEGGLEKKQQRENEILNKKKELYYRNFIDGLIIQNRKKVVFFGIMYILKIKKEQIKDYDELINIIKVINTINYEMKFLTFKEIMNLFPIKKDFDGKKWEAKDYFSTLEYLEQFDLDEMLLDNVDDFIWNYYNSSIMMYGAKQLYLMDSVRMMEGKESFMVGFARTLGVDTYKINKEAGYIYNTTTGKTMPYKEIKPKKKNVNLKIIKNT